MALFYPSTVRKCFKGLCFCWNPSIVKCLNFHSSSTFAKKFAKTPHNCFTIKLQYTDDPFNHELHEVIDVRTPSEYQDDHIPGAVNLPVLSDNERHVIGKEYNNNSFEARRHGASLISKNIHSILNHFMDKPRNRSFLVYCWRGGQRSKSLALVLNMIGYDVRCLEGGYKNYRAQVVSGLSSLTSHLSFNVISGMTGTGKTLFLKLLEEMGEQVLDLEALANHKGSVLGMNYGKQKQPSTRWFETCLYSKMASFNKSKPVWVEAEGRRIGALQIPNSVFDNISNNVVEAYMLQVDLISRVSYIMSDYEFLCKNCDVLKQQLEKLGRFNLPLRKWYRLIDDGNLEQFVCEILQSHYDPMYQKSQSRNLARYVPRDKYEIINLKSIDRDVIYQTLLAHLPQPISSISS